MDDYTKKFLEKRAASHNARWGHIENKFCDIDVLFEIHKRNEHYCKLFPVDKPNHKKKLFHKRIREYMTVLRTGFIRDVLDTLVWEDLELLPAGHRMNSPYKISIYTEADTQNDFIEIDETIDSELLGTMVSKMLEGKV